MVLKYKNLKKYRYGKELQVLPKENTIEYGMAHVCTKCCQHNYPVIFKCCRTEKCDSCGSDAKYTVVFNKENDIRRFKNA